VDSLASDTLTIYIKITAGVTAVGGSSLVVIVVAYRHAHAIVVVTLTIYYIMQQCARQPAREFKYIMGRAPISLDGSERKLKTGILSALKEAMGRHSALDMAPLGANPGGTCPQVLFECSHLLEMDGNIPAFSFSNPFNGRRQSDDASVVKGNCLQVR
jgi:hypothetical protein